VDNDGGYTSYPRHDVPSHLNDDKLESNNKLFNCSICSFKIAGMHGRKLDDIWKIQDIGSLHE